VTTPGAHTVSENSTSPGTNISALTISPAKDGDIQGIDFFNTATLDVPKKGTVTTQYLNVGDSAPDTAFKVCVSVSNSSLTGKDFEYTATIGKYRLGPTVLVAASPGNVQCNAMIAYEPVGSQIAIREYPTHGATLTGVTALNSGTLGTVNLRRQEANFVSGTGISILQFANEPKSVPAAFGVRPRFTPGSVSPPRSHDGG
jgi:hypothetical protein